MTPALGLLKKFRLFTYRAEENTENFQCKLSKVYLERRLKYPLSFHRPRHVVHRAIDDVDLNAPAIARFGFLDGALTGRLCEAATNVIVGA